MTKIRLVLVSCFVLPFILLVGELPANASTVVDGPRHEWSHEIDTDDGDVNLPNEPATILDCEGAAAYRLVVDTVNALYVRASIDCILRVPFARDPDPGDMHDEWNKIEFKGVSNGTGEPCGASEIRYDGTDWLSPTAYELLLNWNDCEISEVCVDWEATSGSVFPDTEYAASDCQDLDMGAIPDENDAAESCEYGHPADVTLNEFERVGTGLFYWDALLLMHDDRDASVPWTIKGMNTTEAVTFGVTTSPSSPASPGQWGGNLWDFDAENYGSNTAQDGNKEPLGAWVFAGNDFTEASRSGLGLTPITVAGSTQFVPGQSVVEECIFWFGPKVWDDPTSTEDEPYGPLDGSTIVDPPSNEPTDVTPTPPDTTDDCSFDVGDPSTWLEGGMCAVVGILKGIWGTLKAILSAFTGLAGAIASAILDGLGALFIPSPGFMDGAFNDVKDSWADTPPMIVSDGLTEVTTAATSVNPGSSCEGPAYTFTEPVNHSVVTLHPFAACSGGMAQLALIVHTALTIGAYIGAYATGLRIISHVFGVDASFSRGYGNRDGLS